MCFQYFGETAHNPETNQRPQRMRSPDVRSPERQGSPYSSRPVSGASDYQNVWPQQPQPMSMDALGGGSGGGSGPRSGPRRASEGCAQRRELTASARTQFLMGAPAPAAAAAMASAFPSASLEAPAASSRGVAWESLPPHCRLSLDAGMLDGGGGSGVPGGVTGGSSSGGDDFSRRESSSSLPTATSSKDSLLSMDSSSTLQDGCSSDDSVILSRIRRSTEQKEEFLRRPAQPIWLGDAGLGPAARQEQGVIAREFYARPQKLQRPVWPPVSEKDTVAAASAHATNPTTAPAEDAESGPGRGAGGEDCSTPQFIPGGPVGTVTTATRSNKSYFSTLSRIQENQPSVSSTGRFVLSESEKSLNIFIEKISMCFRFKS